VFFQNLEFYETEKFQYLLIHKNACTSVRKTIEDLNPKITNKRNLNKVCWTVIREPVERYIHGLGYDLARHGLDIDEIDVEKTFCSYHEPSSMARGDVNHTSSQMCYLINANVNWYVDLKDLNLFLKQHFNKSNFLNKSTSKYVFEDKKELEKYLHLDIEMYNRIRHSPYCWEWQKGKIF